MRKKLALALCLAAALLLTACGDTIHNEYVSRYDADRLYAERAAALLPNVVELRYQETFATATIYTIEDGKPMLVTNYHVFGGGEIYLDGLSVRLHGDTDYRTNGDNTLLEMVAYDKYYDLAVLRLNAPPPAGCADLRSNADYNPGMGDSALAIGNALGVGLAAFDGIISAPERVIESDNNCAAIQTTAAVNAGSSGCPLVSLDGKFYGIGFSQRLTMDGTAEGRPVLSTNYAIPARIVEAVYQLAIKSLGGGQIPYVGDAIRLTVDKREAKTTAAVKALGIAGGFTPAGFTVEKVTDPSKTDLREKDVILTFNGTAVDGYAALVAELYRASPQDAAKSVFTVLREGGETTAKEK